MKANANNTTATMNVANAQSSTANVSGLAGKQDEAVKSILKVFDINVEKHNLFNGRWIDAVDAVHSLGDDYERLYLLLKNDKAFKAEVRSYLPNVAHVVTRKQKDGSSVNQIMYDLCKFTLVEDKEVADWDEKSLKGALVGYRFATDEQFVETADFAALHVQHEYNAPVMVDIVLPNGTAIKVQDQISTTDEEGNVKVTKVTETLVGEFYPQLDEHVSPKAFKAALEKALKANWLKLFPSKEEEKETKSKAAA